MTSTGGDAVHAAWDNDLDEFFTATWYGKQLPGETDGKQMEYIIPAKHIRSIAGQRLITHNYPYQFFAVATAFGSPGSVLKHILKCLR